MFNRSWYYLNTLFKISMNAAKALVKPNVSSKNSWYHTKFKKLDLECHFLLFSIDDTPMEYQYLKLAHWS